MQQTNYPPNYIPTNQQIFDNPQALYPINKNVPQYLKINRRFTHLWVCATKSSSSLKDFEHVFLKPVHANVSSLYEKAKPEQSQKFHKLLICQWVQCTFSDKREQYHNKTRNSYIYYLKHDSKY